MYGYANDAFRAYFLSAKAHNTVVVDDRSYSCSARHTDRVGMQGYRFHTDYDHIRVFNRAYRGVRFQRDFFSADDLTILMDTLKGMWNHTYSQLFHLGEEMEVMLSTDREVVVRVADSGYQVRLRQYGDPVRLEVIHGDTAVPGYGLISRRTNHLDAITIEDGDGLVRLGDSKAPSGGLRFDPRTHTFTIGEFTIPCGQALTEPKEKER